MANFGTADKTGRSSGKLARLPRKFVSPSADQPWVWQPCELLMSEAWRGMSRHCRMLLDFLMVEHRNHAGMENGRLIATYSQLQQYGVARKRIATAIREAEARGLVVRTVKGGRYGLENRRTPSQYRLTWIGTLNPGNFATNDWKKYRKEKKSRHPTAGTAPASPAGTEIGSAPKQSAA